MVDTGDLKSLEGNLVRVQVPPRALFSHQPSRRWKNMIEFYPNSIYYPREAVDEKLAKGELEKMKKHLVGWTERHRDEIWECAREDAEKPTDEILLDNLRALLLCKGSLQPAAEMGEMIREITKEVWYQNENGPKDPDMIAVDWQTKYLTKWREARMFEAFVLIEKNAERLVKILRAFGSEAH